jgi:hypothetical protein
VEKGVFPGWFAVLLAMVEGGLPWGEVKHWLDRLDCGTAPNGNWEYQLLSLIKVLHCGPSIIHLVRFTNVSYM